MAGTYVKITNAERIANDKEHIYQLDKIPKTKYHLVTRQNSLDNYDIWVNNLMGVNQNLLAKNVSFMDACLIQAEVITNALLNKRKASLRYIKMYLINLIK